MHGTAGTKMHSCPYIFLHCVVDHWAQKAYLLNLSTFHQFACHIIVHKRSIGSDGTFAHHLFAYTKVLSQTAKDKNVLWLNSVVTLARL